MGADGGLCWILTSNRKKFDHLVWFKENLINHSAYAFQGEYVKETEPIHDPPKGFEWIEGAYGTDCEYSLKDLLDMISGILERSETWSDTAYIYNSSIDIRDYTFDEFELSIKTDPDNGKKNGVA